MGKTTQIQTFTALSLLVLGCATLRHEKSLTPKDLSQETEAIKLQILIALEEQIKHLELKLSARLSELEVVNNGLAIGIESLVEQIKGIQNQPEILKQRTQPERSEKILDLKILYEEALNEFKIKDYLGAKKKLGVILASDIEKELADNAQYWVGECDYALKNYSLALESFHKVFEYLETEKDDDAQFKLGLCYWNLGNYQKALIELKRLVVDYPQSEYLERTEELIRKIREKLAL